MSDAVNITGGFWGEKQGLIKDVTNMAVYNRFKETGRFEAFKFNYKKGDPVVPHIFWDSDVAKWIEGSAYILKKNKNKWLEDTVDEIVNDIVNNQEENGYFNVYFSLVEPDKKFTKRDAHELYCAGHLMEAAVAYYEATGKDKFLKAMCKYADYIENVFKNDKSAGYYTCGHPEIELALVRLYEATQNERYLNLSKHFIDKRGNDDAPYPFSNKFYAQDQLPLREQTTATGHAVRALYLYSGMADVARYTNDSELLNACKALFDDITTKKMYVTGGCGSNFKGETFSIDYHLPNVTAYAETCAAIALVFFATKMLKLEINSKYADIAELAMYNGVLSGLSLDGDKFFYENPLEINKKLHNVNVATNDVERLPIMQRQKVFGCSCCPPNLTRFIESIENLIYSEDNDAVYIHHYISSDYGDKICMKTNYPYDGFIKISSKSKIALRIPSFCESFTVNCPYELINGYIHVESCDNIILNLDMKPIFVEANPNVWEDCGKLALMKGPIVYCVEGKDNNQSIWNLCVDTKSEIIEGFDENLNVPTLTVKGFAKDYGEQLYIKANDNYKEIDIKFIPYYAFANRGEDDMAVWVKKR